MLSRVIGILSFAYICASFSPDFVLENVRCGKNFCNSIKCEELGECPPDPIVKNSYCGCCDVCSPSQGDQKCAVERAFRIEQRSTGIYAHDLWAPDCDQSGNYLPKQSKQKRRMCVNAAGKRIFGQQGIGTTSPMNCGCSRYAEKLKNNKDNVDFMTEPQVHCTSSGNYDEVQCRGDLCFCADPKTGKAKGRIVKLKYLENLPCRDEKRHVKGYLKPCEVEMIRNRKLVKKFHLKGTKILLGNSVECDPDGTFSPVQSTPTKYVCADSAGKGIDNYFIDKKHILESQMSCSCARDHVFGGTFPKLDCKSVGSNTPYHCFDEKCFCVDEDADLISKELNKTLSLESTCIEALHVLQTLQILSTTTTTQETSTDDEEDTEPPDYDYTS